MPYKPIESYGIIGDMHSAALVGDDGSIDWCCLPYFNSPSVFAAILDDKKGGRFQITATSDYRRQQMYLPDSNVLITRFLSADGVGEIIDFMPVRRENGGDESGSHAIVRIVQAFRGRVPFRLECRPAYDFARQSHKTVVEDRGAVFEAPGMQFSLSSPVPLQRSGSGVQAEFGLDPGETATFVFRGLDSHAPSHPFEGLDAQEELEHTVAYWRRWLAGGRYEGRWRSMVDRSALVLKLLTFQPTGAIIAAPTTSLPGEIGGVRNFDYRYTWIRDAAFTVYAFLSLGHTEEAAHFMDWVEQRVTENGTRGPLRVMYGVDGSSDFQETILDHLEGYRGSKPVRLGNQAVEQLQLDIYGELIDSIYLYDKHAGPISYDFWQRIRKVLDWVSSNWEQPDEGIWEMRTGRQDFVYSKMQCWVALDRGLRMADKRSRPIAREHLLRERDRIHDTIMEKGWNKEINSFVQYFGSTATDAANLLMPLMRFISPQDPRMLSTLDRTMKELVSDSLVQRYRIGKGASDGLQGKEGSFSVCTFWLVEALARAGRRREARLIFEKMLTYANPLGLYSEEISRSGEALGNFPQAYTHLGLISAAISLDRHLGQEE